MKWALQSGIAFPSRNVLFRARSGSALITVVFVAFILLAVAAGLVKCQTLDSRSVLGEYAGTQSLNLARAGVTRAISELRADYHWATGASVSHELRDGRYTVSVLEATANAGNVNKLWKVTSVGTFQGASRKVTAWLEMESFAKFAYFTHAEMTTGGGPIYFVTADRITGPAHTNGHFNFSGTPQFSHSVTSANLEDPFYNNLTSTYTQGGRRYTDSSKFYHYHAGYASDYPRAAAGASSFSFSGAQPSIPLPPDARKVRDAASVLIAGNASLTFSRNGRVKVQQAGEPDRTYDKVLLTIYVDGTATVQGVVAGRATVGASRGIDIVGDVVYHDTARDVLGLVSDTQVRVVTNPNQRRDIEIDASIMALNGSFLVDRHDAGAYRGKLRILGGIIQKTRGAVGTFRDQSVVTGYSKDYVYDERLADTPPPNFPTTGNIIYKGYVDSGALGHSP